MQLRKITVVNNFKGEEFAMMGNHRYDLLTKIGYKIVYHVQKPNLSSLAEIVFMRDNRHAPI